MIEVSILSKTRWKWTGVSQRKKNKLQNYGRIFQGTSLQPLLKQLLELKLRKILRHFKYEGHWERLLKTIWSSMNAIKTPTKAIEHIQIYITVWNFTCEPRATTYNHRILKVISRRCLRDSMQRSTSLGGEGHGIITTVDPTSNRRKWRKKASLFSRGFGRV